VPVGGVAVVLVDGAVAANGVQGPGRITPEPWQSGRLQKKKRIQAVVFPARDLRLTFDVDNLRSKEGVRLDLTTSLTLRIENPAQFLVDVVRGQETLNETELANLLAGAIRTSLQALFARLTLAELDAKADLRDWLGTALRQGLQGDVELLERSGLAVLGVDAYDLRCVVLDAVQKRQETLYLRAALEATDARGRKLLDEQMADILGQHIPIKKDLVEHKEQMAELTEREIAAERRISQAQRQKQKRLKDWVNAWQRPLSSTMRPELWRQKLGQAVSTAPLYAEGQVFVVTRLGQVHAFDAASGHPVWDQPLELGATPGDGMVMAEALLWIPGHNGVLYGVAPKTGALRRQISIGGRLSSAPMVWRNYLILSLDVGEGALARHVGQLARVDIASHYPPHYLPVSKRGIRAQPVRVGDYVFVGDRRGNFFHVDLRTGNTVELRIERGGRILGPVAVDDFRKQVVFGDSYGFVRALDFSGRQRWVAPLNQPIVGQPLIRRNGIFVGAGDGKVYQLDAESGAIAPISYSTDGPINTAPVSWGDWVFVGSHDHYFYAFDVVEKKLFWKFHSGAKIAITPALGEDGTLFVVDSAGNLNALPWHLTQYGHAARWMERAQQWLQAITLWIQFGVADAALEAAEKAGRKDWVADLAAELGWYDKAAPNYEALARRRQDKPAKAAVWWAAAAEQWLLFGDRERAQQCRLRDAKARKAPLLILQQGNLPQVTAGTPAVVQIAVQNLTDHLARDVVLGYRGHVAKAGERSLGALGPHSERLVEIPIVPTASGSARLDLALHYANSTGQPQPPVPLSISLAVSRPPEVHNHYHGPVAWVNGEGVIIMRNSGDAAGRNRTIRIQSGDDEVEIQRPRLRTCPNCGRKLLAPYQFCAHCGWEV
jgi:outer membrane protein assembly factor BamB